MRPSSQNTKQNTTQKNQKIHRSSIEISKKIIAFQELLKIAPKKSAREISESLLIPNSTMQSWRAQDILDQDIQNTIDHFFITLPGKILLHKIVVAAMYNNKCGASGIRGMQEFLYHSELDRSIASSTGALQAFWKRCEGSILSFGKKWEEKLSREMKAKKITIIADEMFRKGKPCLVAIEALSNYILLEKFTTDRKADTWERELSQATKGMPVKIDQVVSDLCGAIRSLTKSIGASHSPDLFHGQYEISKATSAALCSQEKAAEKALFEAEEKIEQHLTKPIRIAREEKKKQAERGKELEKDRNVAQVLYKEVKNRKEEVQAAKKELSQIYHPIDLATGKLQSPTVLKKKMAKEFETIESRAKQAGLWEGSLDRIGKAKRAFGHMWDYYRHFFVMLLLYLQGLSIENRKFFKEVALPLSYSEMLLKRLPKKGKIEQIIFQLHKKFSEWNGREEVKEALMRRGKELAMQFQRSSSSVEGRNGALSLLLHRFHHIDERTLRVLTIVSNFGIKGKGREKRTAAERFFEAKHDDLFQYLVEKVNIPGKPQVQSKKQPMRRLIA